MKPRPSSKAIVDLYYLLAITSAPAEAQQAAIKWAKAGKQIAPAVAKESLAKGRQEKGTEEVNAFVRRQGGVRLVKGGDPPVG